MSPNGSRTYADELEGALIAAADHDSDRRMESHRRRIAATRPRGNNLHRSASTRCRDWLNQLPPEQKPPGVVAGQTIKETTK